MSPGSNLSLVAERERELIVSGTGGQWGEVSLSLTMPSRFTKFYQDLHLLYHLPSSFLGMIGSVSRVQLVHGGREGGVDGGQRDLSTFLMLLGLVSKLRESVHAVAQLLVELIYWILSLIFGQSSSREAEADKTFDQAGALQEVAVK